MMLVQAISFPKTLSMILWHEMFRASVHRPSERRRKRSRGEQKSLEGHGWLGGPKERSHCFGFHSEQFSNSENNDWSPQCMSTASEY